MIVADIEITDRHHLVGALVVAPHEVDLDTVFVPQLGVFGEERPNVIISRSACNQAHLVFVRLLRERDVRHGDACA